MARIAVENALRARRTGERVAVRVEDRERIVVLERAVTPLLCGRARRDRELPELLLVRLELVAHVRRQLPRALRHVTDPRDAATPRRCAPGARASVAHRG